MSKERFSGLLRVSLLHCLRSDAYRTSLNRSRVSNTDLVFQSDAAHTWRHLNDNLSVHEINGKPDIISVWPNLRTNVSNVKRSACLRLANYMLVTFAILWMYKYNPVASTLWVKKGPTILSVHNFSNCWPIFKIFHLWIEEEICSKNFVTFSTTL